MRIGLRPSRVELYRRIDERAAGMFAEGLVEETRGLVERFGMQRPFTSLGYAEALGVLEGRLTLAEAVGRAQQGHRNYAKRQGTWFRREKDLLWLEGFGEGVVGEALGVVGRFLEGG